MSGRVPPQAPQWARDDAGGWPAAALVWALIVLMTVPDNFDYASLGNTAPESGGLLSRFSWLLLLLGGAGLMLRRAALAWLVMRSLNPFLLLFALLSVVSICWSLDPGVTARRCIRVAAVLVSALALMLAGWHPRRFEAVCRPAITLLLAGSLLFGLLAPGLGIHQETSPELAGAWRGLSNHKNTLGMLAGLGAIFWLHAWLSAQAAGWRALAGLILCLICLLLSRSSTSLVTTLFALGFFALLQRAPAGLRPYLPIVVACFAAALLLYALAVLRLIPGANLLLQPVVMLTGKDASFTGRADIWGIVLEHIGQQPLFGNGLGAYWTGPDTASPSYEFMRQLQFYPGSAHSGYLEILNDLGAAGLLCLCGYLVCYLQHSLRIFRAMPAGGGLFLVLFLQQAVTNLSESHWLNVLSLGFVIMTLATAAQARLLLDMELQRSFSQARARPAAGRGVSHA